MGGILGGGKSSDSSKQINASAGEVAKAAQAGGQQMSNAITGASQNSANSILQGSNTAAEGSYTGARTAAENAYTGSQIAAGSQAQALAYLQQTDALPASLRESALRSLGGLYGGSGSITDRAMASPLYQAAVQQGENSVLRNASATGGLRSGTANENLAQVNQNALIAAYNDQINGLQGLASLPSNANTIAGYTAGVGNTVGQGLINYGNMMGQGQSSYGNTIGQGQITSAQTLSQGQISAAEALANANNNAAIAVSQGQIAAANNKAQGSQNNANNMMGLAGLGMQAFSTFSDRRLKKDIVFTGEERGIRKYRWTWNELAERLGLVGHGSGVMADEVAISHPGSVSIRDGYMVVNYDDLGVSHGF